MPANNKALTKVHKFHLVLADGKERDVTGSSADVDHGALVIRDADHQAVVIYGTASWRLCEREIKDE